MKMNKSLNIQIERSIRQILNQIFIFPFNHITMQNMEVIIYPKQLHFSSQQSMNVRLTFKKICISTNHQLEKYENRQSYTIKNQIATINDQVKFKLSKQFQLNNTKVVVIVIGIKGRDISCLGDVTLDLTTLKEKKGKSNELFMAKLDKCKDSKAFLLFDIRFIQKPVDLAELRKKKEKPAQLGLLKTQYFYKQELYISRRQKSDKPTGYEISHNNYKKTEITRNNEKTLSKQKRDSKDSRNLGKQSSNGSYKKRFMYDNQKVQNRSGRKSYGKDIGSNYLKVYQKDKSPSPRTKTPQPITLETLKSRQTANRIRKNVEPLNLSGFENLKSSLFDNSKSQNPSQQNELIDPDTFRAHNIPKSDHQIINQSNPVDMSHSNVSQNSISSISNEKDSKYKQITDKLQMIESKIRNQSKGKKSDDESSKLATSQIEEMESYEIGQGNNKPSISTERPYYSHQLPAQQLSPYQQTEIIPSKVSQSPISLNDSTCPRNQKAPSPISVDQTPRVPKQPQQSFKMSQFTINSHKQLNQQKTPESSSQQQIQESKVSKFDKIIEPAMKEPQRTAFIGQNTHVQGYGSKSRTPSQEKRQPSPSLSLQKRQSELKLQKKSSMGRNYIQTQVKMLELQIQQKDMKCQRLEKKLLKKEQQCNRLIKELQQAGKKYTTLSKSFIETKSKALQLEKRYEMYENAQTEINKRQTQIKRKQEQLKEKQAQILQLNGQIQRLRLKELKQSQKTNKSQPKDQIQTATQLQDSLAQNLQKKQLTISALKQQLKSYQNEVASLREKYETVMKEFKQASLKNQIEVEELQTKIRRLESQNLQLEKLKEQIVRLDSIYEEKRSLAQMSESLALKNCELIEKDSQLTLQMKDQESYIKYLRLCVLKLMITIKRLSLSKKSSNLGSQLQLPATQPTQQLLKQTIQKQTLLQQSLKSLQNQNRQLIKQIENLKQLESENEQLKSRLQSLQGLQTQVQQLNGQVEKKEAQIQQLNSQVQKKDKLIDKVNKINEGLNGQLYGLEKSIKELEGKISQKQEEIQDLTMRNEQKQLIIKDLNQQLLSRSKVTQNSAQKLPQLQKTISQLQDQVSKQQSKIKVYEQLLRDKDEKQSNDKQSKLLRRQPSNHQAKQRENPKSQNVPKVITEGQQSFYEQFMNEKTKSTNLEAQLRFAENKIRSLTLQVDNLKLENKDLSQTIDMMHLNNEKDMTKKNVINKVSLDNVSTTESVKLQNRALKEQIKLLQIQVRDLTGLLDSAIQKTLQKQSLQLLKSSSETQRNILYQKYIVLERRLEDYQYQLSNKKNKMAQMVNAIWKNGNAKLIDQIDKIMGAQENNTH